MFISTLLYDFEGAGNTENQFYYNNLMLQNSLAIPQQKAVDPSNQATIHGATSENVLVTSTKPPKMPPQEMRTSFTYGDFNREEIII